MFLTPPALADEGVYRFTLEGLSYTQKAQDGLPSSETNGIIDLDKTWGAGSAHSFKFHPVIKGSANKDQRKTAVDVNPKELYYQAAGPSTTLRLGAFTPFFEGTDGINPMDIATTKDYSDLLRIDNRASAGLWLGYGSGKFESEFFYVPKQTPGLYPGNNSVWWPRKYRIPVQSEVDVQLPDAPTSYQVHDDDPVKGALDNNVGLRLQYHGDLAEFSVAGFEGAAQWAHLQIVANATVVSVDAQGQPTAILLQSPVEMHPVSYRRRTGAGFIAIPIKEWIIKAATRYDQAISEFEYPGVGKIEKGWSTQSVFGLERSFNFGTQQMLTVILQKIEGHQSTGGGVLSVNEILNGSGILGLRWASGDAAVTTMAGFYNPKTKSQFIDFNLSYRWSDHWTSELIYQMLDGPPESAIATWADRDRAGLRLTATF